MEYGAKVHSLAIDHLHRRDLGNDVDAGSHAILDCPSEQEWIRNFNEMIMRFG